MNISEKEVFIQSLHFFFEPFTYCGLTYETENGSVELCDVLIEYQDVYIAIEIKERDKRLTDEKKWFNQKVKKIAINQLKRDIKILRDIEKYRVIDKNGKLLKLKTKSRIVPVIIFKNDYIYNYEKCIYSKRLGMQVSIFSFNDFVDATSNLIIPLDIINFCFFRNDFWFKNKNNIDNFLYYSNQEFLAIFAGISEIELVNLYIQFVYLNKDINLDKLRTYNLILKELYECCPKEYKKDLIKLLISTNLEITCKLVNKWNTCVERCDSDEHFYPQTIEGFDNDLVILGTRSKNDTHDTFDLFMRNLGEAYAFHFKKKRIYLIGFEKNNGNVTISLLGADIDLSKINEQIKKNIEVLWPSNQ